MTKLEEIEDCLSKIKPRDEKGLLDGESWIQYAILIKNAEDWIKFLLSEVTRLRDGIEQTLTLYPSSLAKWPADRLRKLLEEK